MKVTCIINNLISFSDPGQLKRLRKYISLQDVEIGLELGKVYVVYGIVFWDNSPWYYVCLEDCDEYPTPFAAEFFSVLDRRLSSHWRLAVEELSEGEVYSALVFDEWAEDRSYYEKLVDGNSEAEELFACYRRRMDHEW